jgi:nucleoside-diphosphate-sugar epimerase
MPEANDNRVFDESDWLDITGPNVLPYEESKASAEKAAWEFMRSLKNPHFTLSTICPSMITGPLLSNVPTPSIDVNPI